MTRRMPIHEDRIRPVLPSEALPPRSDKQDLTAQTQALLDLGVRADRIYTDHRFTGRNKARPNEEALSQHLSHLRPISEQAMDIATIVRRSVQVTQVIRPSRISAFLFT